MKTGLHLALIVVVPSGLVVQIWGEESHPRLNPAR